MNEDVVFIPSHLTKALVATGVSMGAIGLALASGGYAIWQYKKVTLEEVKALVSGG